MNESIETTAVTVPAAPPMVPAGMVPTAMTRERVELIKRTVAPGATDDELQMFVQVCERTKLDPFARQIYAIKRRQKDEASGQWREAITFQVSIDGARLVAERSGKYAGQLGPLWTDDGETWREVWLKREPPKAAKVGILRRDFKEPLWAVATWEQYVAKTRDGTPTSMWQKMGPLMLAKCAEMLGLRRAFPQELSGVYSREEMEQADNEQPPIEVNVDFEPKHADVAQPEEQRTRNAQAAGSTPAVGIAHPEQVASSAGSRSTAATKANFEPTAQAEPPKADAPKLRAVPDKPAPPRATPADTKPAPKATPEPTTSPIAQIDPRVRENYMRQAYQMARSKGLIVGGTEAKKFADSDATQFMVWLGDPTNGDCGEVPNLEGSSTIAAVKEMMERVPTMKHFGDLLKKLRAMPSLATAEA